MKKEYEEDRQKNMKNERQKKMWRYYIINGIQIIILYSRNKYSFMIQT